MKQGNYMRIGQDIKHGDEIESITVGVEAVCVNCINDDSVTTDGLYILEHWENMNDDVDTCLFCGAEVSGINFLHKSFLVAPKDTGHWGTGIV